MSEEGIDVGEPEDPNMYITLRQAAEIAGVSPSTLKNQIHRQKLRAVRPGHDWLTTRAWLHEYLTARDDRRGARPAPLPEGYVGPE